MPSLDLNIVDYRGRELDPIVEQASQEFISNDNLVKSRAFYQFTWRTNIGISEERCNKMKTEHLEMEEVDL